MKRMIYWILFIFFGLLAGATITITIFMYTAPQIGLPPEGADLERMKKSPHFKDGIFKNSLRTMEDFHFSKMLPAMYEYAFVENNRTPDKPLPQKNLTAKDFEVKGDSNMRLIWFGHSAFFVEIDGIKLLLDPMLGEVAAPIPFGARRFNQNLPIAIENLPFIDAVIYSHDHYDHLDYPSVLKLKDKVGHWYTALGMGSHLKSWGVDAEKITELDWWESADFGSLKFTATPARHFSGRGFTDRFKTFWNSWVIEGKHQKLYFSGDGGYFDGFSQIGEKFGPFDICLIECGAYNEAWSDIHMMPEESAQACVDLKGRLMMPIHWGAFSLALHSWTEPVTRLTKKAEELGVKLVTPVIGEEVVVPTFVPNQKWWGEISDIKY